MLSFWEGTMTFRTLGDTGDTESDDDTFTDDDVSDMDSDEISDEVDPYSDFNVAGGGCNCSVIF